VEWSWCYGADAWTGGSWARFNAMQCIQVVTSWWVWYRVRMYAVWYDDVQRHGVCIGRDEELCYARNAAWVWLC
jgi:hypothetical protein